MKATRDILYNYSYLTTELKLKQIELEHIRTNDGITAITYELTPPSQTNVITSKVEQVGDNNLEREKQLLGEIRRLQMNMQKIENVLEILNDVEREIIRLRYTEDKPWGYIADVLDYSEKHCQRMGRHAIMKVTSLLFGIKSFVDLPLFNGENWYKNT